MQPLGRKHNPSKEDIHPPYGYINWWEDVVTPSKKAARQEAKKFIEQEINMLDAWEDYIGTGSGEETI